MDECFPPAKQCPCDVLALRHRVVPMFDAAPFVSEDRVRIVRDISGSQDVGMVCFEEFVDDNAVVGLQTCARSQIRDGLHSNAGNEQIETGGIAALSDALTNHAQSPRSRFA